MPDFSNYLTQTQEAQKTQWQAVLEAALQSAATRISNEFEMPYGSGMILTVVVANEAGTCSFTPKLSTTDAYGTAIVWWTAASAITANGTYQYLIYPVAVSNGAFTECVAFPMPRNWKLTLTYAGTPASDKMDTKAAFCYV